MGIIELLLIAVGLAMDAFAVSVCKGLALKHTDWKTCAVCGVWFGGFQAAMPLIGFLSGIRFKRYVDAAAPWIAFILLALVGVNMIREALSKDRSVPASLDFKTMLCMAVATSIDALAVGITFACVPVRISSAGVFVNTLTASAVIGAVTFVMSCAGVKIGSMFGIKYKLKSELAGGVILLLIGLRILLEHFFQK